MIKTSLYRGDSASLLSRVRSNSVDLVVTSPPYDKLRSYGGAAADWGFSKFKDIANELARVLKDGGLIVWNVKDLKEKDIAQVWEDNFEMVFCKECVIIDNCEKGIEELESEDEYSVSYKDGAYKEVE